MLGVIEARTVRYLSERTREERRQYEGSFTDPRTARFMAGLFSVPEGAKKISVLDAGAGAGMLSVAAAMRLEEEESVEEVELVCYETDPGLLRLLRENLREWSYRSKKKTTVRILAENYITSQYLDVNCLLGSNPDPEKFDFVIMDPPRMKIPKDAPEATAMPEICHGAPNLYFIFAAMAMFNLRKEGQLVCRMPRSWTSGAYFARFRQYFLTEGKPEQIHLTVSRNEVFDRENFVAESMILKARKTKIVPKTVTFTYSEPRETFADLVSLTVPYSLVIAGERGTGQDPWYVHLITDAAGADVLKKIRRFSRTLPELGFKMKTGLMIVSKNQACLRDEMEEGAIPLFGAQNILGGKVDVSGQAGGAYAVTDQRGLMQDNRNYLFVKRFTEKGSPRLQCGVYLASSEPEVGKISTRNDLNFVDGIGKEMEAEAVYGLCALFGTSLYDEYYRILNSSTQVNSTEMNSVPVPELEQILEMGRGLMESGDFSRAGCNRLLAAACGNL